jgi:hypothetical protein
MSPAAQRTFVSFDIRIESVHETGEIRIAPNQHERFEAFHGVEVATVGLTADFQHVDVGDIAGSFGIAEG